LRLERKQLEQEKRLVAGTGVDLLFAKIISKEREIADAEKRSRRSHHRSSRRE